MVSIHGPQGHEPCTLPLSYLAFFIKKVVKDFFF